MDYCIYLLDLLLYKILSAECRQWESSSLSLSTGKQRIWTASGTGQKYTGVNYPSPFTPSDFCCTSFRLDSFTWCASSQLWLRSKDWALTVTVWVWNCPFIHLSALLQPPHLSLCILPKISNRPSAVPKSILPPQISSAWNQPLLQPSTIEVPRKEFEEKTLRTSVLITYSTIISFF